MAQSVKVNAAASAVRQVSVAIFPLITIPYITRVIGADAYGMVNYSASIVQYFTLLAGLGISTYALREGAALRDDREAFTRFASEMFSFNVSTSFCSFALLAVFLVRFDSFADYRLLMVVQALGIIFNTVGVDWVNSAYEDFVYLTVRYVAFQAVAVICMFLFVHSPADYVVYALFSNLSSYLGCLCNVFYTRRYVRIRFTLRMHVSRHIKAILVLFGNSVSQTLYLSANTTILGVLTTNYAVGLFSVPSKIYSLVKGVLNSVTLVVVPRVASYVGQGRNDDAQRLLIRVLDSLLVFCIPSIVGLFALSDDLVVLLAGSEYAEGGFLLKLLSLALLFATAANIFANSVLIPLRQEKTVLLSTLIAGLSSVTTSFVLIPLVGVAGAAFATLVAEFIVLAICYARSLKFFCVLPTWKGLAQVCLGSLAVSLFCLLVKWLFSNEVLAVAICIGGSALLYGGLLLVLGNDVVRGIWDSCYRRILKLGRS